MTSCLHLTTGYKEEYADAILEQFAKLNIPTIEKYVNLLEQEVKKITYMYMKWVVNTN